jgi:superfamily II DNA/RNA helicase
MPHSTFENYGLPPKLIQALSRNKFMTPTPIQAQTIPLALEGKDILGSAQTGTGKTGAFGIPIIAGLMARPESAALIMTPTRELASQVMAALEPMIPSVEIRTALLIGGEAMPRQFHQLRHNPRLIVGTPGRINDHLERGSLKLDQVRFLVLDETDRMLDMGFGIQIERILKYVPSDRQTLLFSATLPSNITKLSGKYMRDPVRVAVGSTSTPLAKIKQDVIPTTDAEKYGKLVEQLNSRKGSIIIFVKTKFGTEKLADKLNKADHKADAIHGDLQQRRRERVIQNFRDKKYRILVATDVAARGLDIPHIAHVINYDMPQAPEDYIHRIGRTARAGAEGEAVSFLTGADNVKWRAIQRLMNGEDPNVAQPRSGGARRGFGGGGGRKPFWKRDGDKQSQDRPHSDRPRGDKPYSSDQPRGERHFGDKPRGEKSYADRPQSDYKPKHERASGEHTHKDRVHSDKPRSEAATHDRPRSERSFSDRPRSDRPREDGPRSDRPRSDRPYSDRPRGDKPYGGDKPRGERHFGDKPRGEASTHDRPRSERSYSDRPRSDKPKGDKPYGDKPFGDKPRAGKYFAGKPRAQGGKPYRGGSSAPRGRA